MNFILKKNKKGTVILLSLFLIFFTVSIIGIIYSYNKRIFQLAKQERDNYKVFKKKFDDIFTNLYIVDLIEKDNWTGQGIENLSFIQGTSIDFSYTYNYTGNRTSSSINISGSFPTENTFSVAGKSFDISSTVNNLKNLRNEIADKLNSAEAKNEIENDLKNLLGNDILFTKFEHPNNINDIINDIKNGQSRKIEYTIEFEKKINIPIEKGKTKEIKRKYEIKLEYEVSITGLLTTYYNKTFEGTPNYDIYGNVIDYSFNITDTANGIVELIASLKITRFEIKRSD